MKKLYYVVAVAAATAGCVSEKPEAKVQAHTCATPCRCGAADNVLSEAEIKDGWTLLWDGKTGANWVGVSKGCKEFPDHGWLMEDGVLTVIPQKEGGGGGDIVTEKMYKDFIFKVDFRLTKGANSGIKYYFDEKINNGTTLEFQLLDPNHPDAVKGRDGNRRVASLYDMMPANADALLKPVGEWNTAMLVCKKNQVWHYLNGKCVLKYTRGDAKFMEAFRASKYADKKGFDRNGKWGLTPVGRIQLQDHRDSRVSFKNIKIKELHLK